MTEGVARQRHDGLSHGPEFWLLYAEGDGPACPLTLGLPGGREVLAIFSGEGEASVFALLATIGEIWRTKETSSGEIVSLLYGPCSGVLGVALDPSPEMLDRGLLYLVTLDRRRFIRRFASPEVRWKAVVRTVAREDAPSRG